MMKKNQGFTVVELLIAIGVFAVIVPSLAGFLNLLSIVNDRARDTSVINALIENKVESLRSISFVGITDGTTDFTAELPDTISEPNSATYEVSSLSSSLKAVDLTVTYNDHGQNKTMTYRTYIGELGVGQY